MLVLLSIFRSCAVHSSVKSLWEFTKDRSEIIIKLMETVKRPSHLIAHFERTDSWKTPSPIPTELHQLVHGLQFSSTRANNS